MPAKKPAALIVRDETKADRNRRADRAAALTPSTSLSVKAPPQLMNDVARVEWQRIIRLYMTLDARIVSLLDAGLLIDYCNVYAEQIQIGEMKVTAISNHAIAQLLLDKLIKSKKDDVDAKTMVSMEKSVNTAFNAILKLDARSDNKRKLLHTYRQSLMLTPRSRGGVTPDEKPKEKPQSEMAKIIDGEVKKEKRKKNV